MEFLHVFIDHRAPPALSWGLLKRCSVLAIMLCIGACAVGPDYHKPSIQIPESFKEGNDWQRAQANPQGSLQSGWWTVYHDDKLTQLITQSQKANQSIAASESAYRLALAIVEANTASLFPTITSGFSGSRSGFGSAESSVQTASTSGASGSAHNSLNASLTAGWELDLWGAVRRQIEEAKSNAQASDAQLAGERLSIASSLATDYFQLRQADMDIEYLKQQQSIDSRILDITRTSYTEGEASSDQVLFAQDTLDAIVVNLQTSETTREQDEHAIAVLIGMPPAGFELAVDSSYAFAVPEVPLSVPSQLLERRYDVVSAERTASAANAHIGVATAAFFPDVSLSAQGGFQHNSLAHLFSLPSRAWTLGPDLAATIFDGGARTAAVHQARAAYDEDVATYRNTVLTAFENVEDSLSNVNHLKQQAQTFSDVLLRNQQLFSSERAQLIAGAISQQDLLTQQLLLLQAQQNLSDARALLTEGTVSLIKSLGGGWRWDDSKESPAVSATSSSGASEFALAPLPELNTASVK